MPRSANSFPEVLLFDVNETLLDLKPLEESIDRILLEIGASKRWFTTMLQYSLAMTVSQRYAPLPEIGAATLRMLARNREVELSEEEAQQAMQPMLSLPAHPEVKSALERLTQNGFRLATLTNSSSSGVKTQLKNAGLSALFEKELSVEVLGKYKPHRDVYLWAAQQMNVEPTQCMLVAAHGWDIAGAKWAGLQAAFVERAGQQLFPLAEAPDAVVPDISALADMLIE